LSYNLKYSVRNKP